MSYVGPQRVWLLRTGLLAGSRALETRLQLGLCGIWTHYIVSSALSCARNSGGQTFIVLVLGSVTSFMWLPGFLHVHYICGEGPRT